MGKESFFKMMKGMGKNLANEAINLGEIGLGAGRGVYETGKTARNIGSKMFKPLAEGEKAESLIQKVLPYKMKTGAALGITAALGAYAIGDEGVKANSRGKLGTISSGEMANTIGVSRSPNLDGKVDQVMENEKAMEDFARNDLKGGTYGAEGDIVFALHNLRNGQ